VIVLDASAMVEALVGRAPDEDLLDALSGDVDAPHLLDVEVLSVLRGLVRGGKLDTATADQAGLDHFAFTITRHETAPLADRIWQLRHQFTSYDASYLALAEALDAPLYTCDSKLATGGHNAMIHLVAQTTD
jgi:predicted nucleic acid-binding protein